MVKISSSWVGRADGKMGEGVYFVRKGITCGRSYVRHVNDADTEKQETQRSKFDVALIFCQVIKSTVKNFWTSLTPEQTAFNGFMGYILKYALMIVGGIWEPDWTKVRFASGTLSAFQNPGATNPSGQTIIYTWVDNSGYGGATPDDTFAYMFVNTNTYPTEPDNSVVLALTTQKRSDQTYSFSAPAGWTGNDVAVYGCFLAADGSVASDSFYFGTLTLH